MVLLVGQGIAAAPIDMDSVAAGFRDPPKSVRPKIWWIWFNNAVEKEELLRELKAVDEAGFGGVCVQMNGGSSFDWWNGCGPEEKEWLSPEWFDCMQSVTDEAARRGMAVDTMANTGWSLGGDAQVVPPADCSSKLHLVSVPVAAGTHIEISETDLIKKAPRYRETNRIRFLRLLPADPAAFTAGTDLMDHLKEGVLEFDAPAGDWVLYAGVWIQPWVSVHAGCGAHGFAVDPYSPAAVRRYLDKITPAFAEVYGDDWGRAFRAFGLESVEFEGANWTERAAQEFESEHGYSLEPFLPMIAAQEFKKESFPAAFFRDNAFGDTVRRVRYDYHKTMTRLAHEGIYAAFMQWCRERGVRARMQTAGSPWVFDQIQLGSFADIPEPEIWLYNPWSPKERVDYIACESPKMAASGAHIGGRSMVSSETFTSTRGVYQIQPWYVKQGNDINALAGVNAMNVHTFPYRHPGTPYPAGFWYGCWSEDNTWWEYVKEWTAYNGRIAHLMQRGVHQAQVLILDNREEALWHSPKSQSGRFDYKHHLWKAVAAQGFGSDFINEPLLQRAVFEGGRLVCGEAAWDLLLIPEREALEPETVKRLAMLAEQGAQVRFVGSMPQRSFGLKDAAAGDALVRDTCRRLLTDFPERVRQIASPEGSLIEWTAHALAGIAASCRIEPAAELLMQTHFSIGERDFFFMVNSDRNQVREFKVSFERNAPVEIWDPCSGERFSARKNRGGAVDFRLEPLESVVFVLSPRENDLPQYRPLWPRQTVLPITSEWTARMIPGEGAEWVRKFGKPADFAKTRDERLLNFAGTVIYETRFGVDDPAAADLLSLGEVQYTSEVWLNDHPLGVRWWGKHVYETGNALRAGENILRVKVTTPIWNDVRNRTGKGNPAVDHQVAKVFSGAPGYGNRPMSAGLIGPVLLMKGE